MPGLSYIHTFFSSWLVCIRSQTKPTHHRPWLLCLSSLLVAEPSPSFCFPWHSLWWRNAYRHLIISCCHSYLSPYCDNTPDNSRLPLSFGDHFHCDHNSHVSVFIWGFTMAHTLRVQSVMNSRACGGCSHRVCSRERGRRILVFSMVSPFYSVQDPNPWCTHIQGGSSCLN